MPLAGFLSPWIPNFLPSAAGRFGLSSVHGLTCPDERRLSRQAGRTALPVRAAFAQPAGRAGNPSTQQEQVALCADHDRYLRREPGGGFVRFRPLPGGAALPE